MIKERKIVKLKDEKRYSESKETKRQREETRREE